MRATATHAPSRGCTSVDTCVRSTSANLDADMPRSVPVYTRAQLEKEPAAILSKFDRNDALYLVRFTHTCSSRSPACATVLTS